MPSAGIGVKLREARERAGLSLRQVSDSTKIPTSLLQAIERNDVSRLPGGLYSRGYVRSIALAVALDPEATVAEFVAGCPQGSVKDGYPAAERAAMEEVLQKKRSATWRTRAIRPARHVLRRIAGLGAPAVLAIYLGVNGLPAWPSGRPAADVRQAGLGDMFGEAAAAVEGRPSPRNVSQAPALDPLPSRFLEVRAEVIAVPSPAAPIAGRSFPVQSADAAPATESVAIVLTARRPSWVIATVDGRKTVNRLLEPGTQEAFEARRDLTLTLGDAGAVLVTLNGRPARALGREGEPATAHVTNANFRTYLRR